MTQSLLQVKMMNAMQLVARPNNTQVEPKVADGSSQAGSTQQ
jgi:hypothetical protein